MRPGRCGGGCSCYSVLGPWRSACSPADEDAVARRASSGYHGARIQTEGVGVRVTMSDQHLSQIATQWTMLFDAHRGPEDAAQKARKALMIRYCGAVYRYLARVVRDPAL